MTTSVQAWIAVVGALGTAILGILKYFNYKSRRDRSASVGQSFRETVDGLASDVQVKRLAAAILLRRFFDRRTEQGAAGASYQRESIAVIAALLRATETGDFQKLLADGLAHAPSLRSTDLQGCNLEQAYLSGERLGHEVDLSDADLYEAKLTRASLKGSKAERTVFYHAILIKTVFRNAKLAGADFREADLTDADFREADLEGARFENAVLVGARFDGATNVPAEVELALADGPATTTVAAEADGAA